MMVTTHVDRSIDHTKSTHTHTQYSKSFPIALPDGQAMLSVVDIFVKINHVNYFTAALHLNLFHWAFDTATWGMFSCTQERWPLGQVT